MVRIVIKLLIVFSLSFSGCSKKKEESEATTSKVELLPTLSASLKEVSPSTTTASSLNLLSSPATKEEALVNFFNSTYSGISGTSAKGFLNASVGDLDSRITQLNGQFEKEPECVSATPTTWTISTGSPVNYSIDLKISCLSKFSQTNGDLSGVGSGLAWGKDDNYYYIALILFQSNGTDKFGYFATYNKTSKSVNLLFMEYSPSYSRTTVYKVKGDPTTKSFQLAMAGSGFSAGPMFPALGCNTRMISNGTELLVAGKAGETNSSGVCQTAIGYVFDSSKCFTAASVTTTSSTCSTLSTSSFSSEFTEFDGTQVEIAKSNINTNLSFSSIESSVSAPK